MSRVSGAAARGVRLRTLPGRAASSAAIARLMGWTLLLAAALLYFFTLDNGLAPGELEGGDLITHQYAQVQARPSNAPGYPLYTIGGWLWFHGLRAALQFLGNFLGDPLPNPVPILSSYSTVWALLALGLLYATLLRLGHIRRNWPLAWGIAGFYAVSYFFWYYATTTEQYSSAIAHTLAIVYVYLLWEEATQPDKSRRLLLLLAFLCGLSLAHLVTVAVIVPPLVLAVLWRQPALLRRPRLIAGTVLAAALPLLSYVYVYWRGAAHPEWWGQGEWTSASDWFWSFVRTAQGQDELSWGLQPGAPFFGNGFPQLIWQELSVPLLLLGLLGIWLLPRRLRFVLYGTLALYLILAWVDRFGNWFQVILPAYPLVLLGLMPLAEAAKARLARVTPLLGALPFLLLLLATGWRFAESWPQADSRNRTADTALIRPAHLLAQPLPPGAGLFAEKADALGLDYLISIWGIRPDLTVVSSPQAAAALASGQAVAATWQSAPLLLNELPADLRFAPQGIAPDWVLLWPPSAADALPQPQKLLGKSIGDGIELVGYSAGVPPASPLAAGATDGLDVTLFWRVEPGTSPADWAISVRPLAGGQPLTAGGAAIQQDSPGPVHGLRPFPSLPPGQIVPDSYRLDGAGAADGLLLIVYRPVAGGFENLAELHLPRE